ncbi:MAG: sialidase family protein, partial [Thermoleophilaceae bacterium]
MVATVAGVLVALAAPASGSAAVVNGLEAVSSASPFPAGGCGVPGQRNADTEGEPSIAVNPRNARNLIAVWQQDRFTIDGGALSDVVGVSKDGGRTWKQVLVQGISRCTGGADERASDPWLSFGPDGRAYLATLSFTEHPDLVGKAGPTAQRVSTSTDGGLTWSSPSTVVDDGRYNDRGAVTADPTRRGTAYHVWVLRTGTLGEQGVELFSKTTNGGGTWSKPRQITRLKQGTVPDPMFVKVFPDGTLLNLYVLANATAFLPPSVPRTPWDVMAQRSTNGGRSWSKPVKVASIQPPSAPQDPDTGAVVRAYNEASLDIAPDGTAYVAWNVIASQTSSQVLFSKSIDGGRSWSKQAAVAKVSSQAFLPSLAVGGDGTVGVYWDDLRNDRPGDGQLTTDVFYAISKNGGGSWRQGHLAGPFNSLTAPPTDSTTVAGRFLGDYQGVAGLRDGSIAALFPQAQPQAKVGGTDTVFARLHMAGRVVKPRLSLSVRPKRVAPGAHRRVRFIVTVRG